MAVMLPAHSTDCLMLHTEELAIYMAGHNMCGTMASPAVAAGGEMAGDAVNIVAGGACARTRRAERLPVNGADQCMFSASGAPA